MPDKVLDFQCKLKESNWSKEFEKPIYEEWKKSKTYSFNPNSKKKVYSIDTPPPYVNAPVHMGHAATYILMDMFARFRRMAGFEVLFPLGLDRNGLPIEMATEKKFNVTPNTVPREKFIEYCKQLLEEFSLKSTETFLRAGIGFSSWEIGNKLGDVYLTDSDEYRRLTQETFIDLWNSGLIKIDKRVNNYCPKCQTTIADAEIEYREDQTLFNYVKFKVKETGEEIIIGTTRPELLAACGAVLYNPEDKRYQKLKGKTAITPIYGKEIPIKAHQLAKIEAGTGLVMMCSFGDYTDVWFFREEKLKHTILIDTKGRLNKEAGFLEGLKVEEARKKILEEAKRKGLLVKHEQVSHRTPICERSKTPIEFVDMEEYYLKQLDFLPELRKLSDKINFYSQKNKQILLDWFDSLAMDWAISRRRVYATEIPLWYCENKNCGEIIVPEKGKYYKPWKENPPVKECPKCKGKNFTGETRVFDTWFDSSVSPLYILKYGSDKKFFEKAFPATLRPQGKEIVRTWLYYTLLRCYQLTDKPVFEDVWIHNHILDGKGEKMAKSKGNVIDPAALIDKFGAEPVRLWAALEGNLTDGDFMCSEEKIRGNGKFLTKLWNVTRFISGLNGETPKKQPRLSVLDQWILSEIGQLTELAKKQYMEYDFHKPATKLRHFIWEIFASHYLELVKSRAYNKEGKFTGGEQESAIWTLNHVLDLCLKLLAPVAPFITYKLYMDLRGKDIHAEKFPEAEKIEFSEFTTEELVDLNSSIWKLKKEKGLSLKDSVEFKIPEKFKAIERELVEMHKLER